MSRSCRGKFNHSQQLTYSQLCLVWYKSTLSFTRVSGRTLNRIWSFLRLCSQASRFPLNRVNDRPPLQAKCFRVGLLHYLGLNSDWSVPINVSKTRKHFFRNIHGARMFPQCFPLFPTGNIVSSFCFCFQDANSAYATRQGILRKNQACEQLQKNCEHDQASSHLIFASNSSKSKFCEHFQIEWDSIPLLRPTSWRTAM